MKDSAAFKCVELQAISYLMNFVFSFHR